MKVIYEQIWSRIIMQQQFRVLFLINLRRVKTRGYWCPELFNRTLFLPKCVLSLKITISITRQ